MSDISLKIKEFRIEKKLTQDQLAEKLGVNRASISQFEAGKIAPSNSTLINLQRLFNGETIDTFVSEPEAEYGVKIKKTENLGVPIYDLEFSAGLLPFGNGENIINDHIFGYMNFPEFKGAEAIVKVKGDSMSGYIENGDWIAIKKVPHDIINFGHVYAILTTDELPMIKYIRKGPNNETILLKSHNKNYDDFEIPKSKIMQLFIVMDKVSIKGLSN